MERQKEIKIMKGTQIYKGRVMRKRSRETERKDRTKKGRIYE
jgi:hypothetical protein